MVRSEIYETVLFAVSTIVLLLMALFSVSFIYLYHRRQRESLQEKQILKETYQRELLQSQIEIQNQTLQQIAQELHDHIGQLLTVTVMRLDILEEDVKEADAQESVQQTRELVGTIISDVRTLAKTLDYNTVQRFGLLPSLTLELERIQRVGRVQTRLTTTGEPYSLGEQTETVLLRMAQESFNNALKHARARTLTVAVDFQPDTFVFIACDDGQGFHVDKIADRSLEQAGAGLGNLARRAGLLGGTCRIVSQPGEGTRVEIQIPRYPVRP